MMDRPTAPGPAGNSNLVPILAGAMGSATLDGSTRWRGADVSTVAGLLGVASVSKVAAVRGLTSRSDFAPALSVAAQVVAAETIDLSRSPLLVIAADLEVVDFTPISATDWGAFPALRQVTEGGEVQFGTVAAGAEMLQLLTYGRNFSVTRTALVSRDFAPLREMATRIGMAVAALESTVLAAPFVSNPAMADGVPVWHTDHQNVTGSVAASALVDGVAAGAALLRKARLRDTDGAGAFLNLAPRFLVAGAGLERPARQAAATFMATTASEVNPWAGNLEVVIDANLPDNAAFLAADPSIFAGLHRVILAGTAGLPVIDVATPLEVDAVVTRALIDIGGGISDYRPIIRIPVSGS
jgi:hypothetical protein